jgi:hypothetical protein
VATPSLAKSVRVTVPGMYPDFRPSLRLAKEGENFGRCRSALSEPPSLPALTGQVAYAAPADYSGGTVADFHGLPISPSQLNCFHAECMPRRTECQITRKAGSGSVSGYSGLRKPERKNEMVAVEVKALAQIQAMGVVASVSSIKVNCITLAIASALNEPVE